MELRHLRYFIATAEEENVSRAALKLHVSQPAISRQIHDLEYELGFQLFERSAKSLKLTEAGKKFLADAKTILQFTDDAVKNAKAVASGARGEIHVGYAPSLTVKILPPTLRAFQAQFPNVRVALHDLSGEEMLARLREEKLHVALTVLPEKETARGLQHQELARHAVCVAVAPKHPLARSKSVKLEQLVNEPLIGFRREEYPGYLDFVENIFAPLGRAPRVVEEHDGITSLLAAVEAGRGIALVSEAVACLVGPRVKVIPAAGVPPVAVVALWKKGAVTALVEKFVTAALESAR
ncbi:MAG: LysR family transcriptional regulator [Verrucomicrobia bacterium]|nr:LysR family transcriptional regulator [Verrucomicrobiota bacterium]MDE3098246.1 LysR family transcriptional regulator [Verrucomicrobiota bacterium]